MLIIHTGTGSILPVLLNYIMQVGIIFSAEKCLTDNILNLSSGLRQTAERIQEGYHFDSSESFIRFAFHFKIRKKLYLLVRHQTITGKESRNAALNILLNGEWVGRMAIDQIESSSLNYMVIYPDKLKQGINELFIRLADNRCAVAVKELWLSDYIIDKQLQSNWCWAAVTTSLARFYEKDEFTDQAKLVSAVFKRDYCCAGTGCGTCNRPWYIGDALFHATVLQKAIPCPVSKKELMNELRANRPVVIVIKWHHSATGHILVVSGFTRSHKFFVWDSRGASMRLLSFKDMAMTYEGRSTWVNTFFTGYHEQQQVNVR